MAFKLFGGNDKKAETPNEALQQIFDSVCGGKLEEILDIFQVSDRMSSKILGLPAPVRVGVSSYAKKIFKQSKFQVGGVQMQADGSAAVQAAGKTFDGVALTEVALEVVERRGKEMGLFSGGKSPKMLLQALGMIDEILKKQEIGMVKGIIHMEKENGEWRVKDQDELTWILCRAPMSKLIPEAKKELEKIRENA